MVRSYKTPAFWSKSDPTRRRFEVFQSTLEQVHGLVLPKPDFSSSGMSSFKDFCSAILERRKHIWDVALRRSRDLRFSVGMSLFLFRKIIPSSRPDVSALLDKLTTPSPEPDWEFMEFVRRQVPKLFPIGWDSQYPQHCLNSVVPTKSYAEKRKCEDGCSRMWFLRGSLNDEEARSSFIETVLASTSNVLRDDVASRIQVVPSSGKYRALSIPQVRMNYLRPLHKTMYDYMSRYKWLLRGDAKVARFRDFCAVEGEELVSGDYESATDNLNLNVQKEILRLVLQNARHVPHGIIVSAMKSCSPKLTLSDDAEDQAAHYELKSGQMMGNLLSFPLLCLVNYLTFKYLVPRAVPVRINGDDIVFRCRPEETRRWMEGVQVSGLTLSRGKTIVDSRYFTINSTMFKGSKGGVRQIPFLRAKSLFGKGEEDVIESLAGRCRAFYTCFRGKAKSILLSVFFKENSGHIKKSCRSITQGLSIKAQPKEIMDAGLWSRELRYLSAGDEKPLPVSKSWWANNPEGWHLRWVSLKEKKRRERSQELSARFVEAAWKSPLAHATVQVKDEARSTGLDMSDARVLRNKRWTEKMTSLIRMPYRWIKTRFSHNDPLAWDKRPTKSRFACWFKDDEPSSFTGFAEGDKLSESREAFSWLGDARFGVDYPVTITLLPQSSKESDEVVENTEELPTQTYTYCFKPPTELTDGKYIMSE